MIMLRSRILNLPFVQQLDGSQTEFSLWNVAPSGNWSADCRLGRAYARETVDLVRKTEAVHLINGIARAQLNRGLRSGIEVGYVTYIAEQLLRGG